MSDNNEETIRWYEVRTDQTADFNLNAFNLPNPPDRITMRGLLSPDKGWRWCSAEVLIDIDPLIIKDR